MKTIYAYFIIILGDILLAIGLDLFLLPNHLSTGGFSGIATIINNYINMPIGTIIILLNIILIIYALFLFKFRILIRTIISILLFGVFSNLFLNFEPITNDLLLASLCGGLLVGIGIGLNFKVHSTTGGSDLLVKIWMHYSKKLKANELIFIIDIIIIILFIIVFKDIDYGLYSIIAIFVASKIIDLVIEGINTSIMVYVISSKNNEIAEKITNDIKRGVTIIDSQGYYTKQNQNMLCCVISKYQIQEVKELISRIDNKAFVIITQAKEVLGYGFKEYEV